MSTFVAGIVEARVPDPGVRIWPLRQAGFVVRGGGRTLLLDPWLSDWLETESDGNPHPVRRARPAPCASRDLPPVDVVFCTHEHPDHLDLDTLTDVARRSAAATFVVPAPLVGTLVDAGIAADRVVGVRVDEPVTINGVEVLALPAAHAFADGSFGGYTFWCDDDGTHRAVGYVVRLGGVTLFHSGDTVRFAGDAERLRRERVDVVLLPVNGRDWPREAQGLVGNLHPAEAVDLAAGAGARHLVACHFDGVVGNTGDPAAVVAYAVEHEAPLTVHVLGPAGLAVLP